MRFTINGGKKLSGVVHVNGAKNSVIKAMASSLLFDSPLRITNVPAIEEVFRMAELLEGLGAKVTRRGHSEHIHSVQRKLGEISPSTVSKTGLLREVYPERSRRARNDRTLEIDPREIRGSELKKDVAKRSRASIVLVGPLLARHGRAVFPYPGGCVIGRRPVDIFIDGWQAMGAKVKNNKEGFLVSAKKLKGIDFTFRIVSVTGTETLMMTAALAHGKTVLRNVALEPEIAALAKFLNASGAQIKGAGTSTIEITGTGGRKLVAREGFEVMPDRIEAGSFLILGAALGGKLKVVGCNPDHLSALLTKLHDAGVDCGVGNDWVSVSGPRKLLATDVQTREYPGFPTDLQAPFATLMTQAQGESVIFETIFENRFGYVDDLKRMGADIFLADPHRIVVKGPASLRGREIESPDLRAGLALVVAALLAKGESIISNVYQIDRGYEKIDERLRKLGAEIERVE